MEPRLLAVGLWEFLTLAEAFHGSPLPLQEIGYTHMRVAEGVNSLLQMAGLLARLCSKTAPPAAS